MNREIALDILSQQRPELARRFGLKSLSLFGPFARDEAGPESDVGVLVEFNEPPGLSGYIGVKFSLEEKLGGKVDLVMKGALKPWALPHVEAEAIDVA